MSHQLITWPRLLHDAGYETGYVGKWHMGNDDMPRPGFDRWVSFKGQGVYEDPPMNIDGKPVKSVRLHDRPHLALRGRISPAQAQPAVRALRRTQSRARAFHARRASSESVLDRAAPEAAQHPRHARRQTRRNARRARTEETADAEAETEAALRGQRRGLDPQPTPRAPGRRRQHRRGVQGSRGDRAARQHSGRVSSDNGFFWGEHGLADKRWSYEESYACRCSCAIRD